MKAGIRKRSNETYTDLTIESVISGLNSDTPITKKTACAMLCINYNTTRLDKIINEYIERKEFISLRKKQLRNTKIDIADSKYIVEAYIDSQPLQGIADSVFRSVSVVKRILATYNIPIRTPSASYFNPIDLKCNNNPSNDYISGDLVYSARYDTPATIRKSIGNGDYSIWLHNICQYAYQPYYELGDLREAQTKLSIKIEELSKQEMDQLIYDARKNAKKRTR